MVKQGRTPTLSIHRPIPSPNRANPFPSPIPCDFSPKRDGLIDGQTLLERYYGAPKKRGAKQMQKQSKCKRKAK